MSNLFSNEKPKVDIGEIADIYDGRERTDIDYNSCKGCPLRGNPKIWTWRGNYDSKLCVVGMNPGAKEKRHGYPFVGPSGVKLEKRLIDKLELSTRKRPFGPNRLAIEGDFYLTNVVKCWTSNNGNPTTEAVRNCWKYLEPELEGREVIAPLGKLAHKAFDRYYNGPAIIHKMIHPSAACRKGIYDARLISQVKELSEIIEE